MTSLYGFNAVTRSNNLEPKSQTVDDVYNSFVLGGIRNREIAERSESFARRALENVVAPVIVETAEKKSPFSWASRFPTLSKIVGKGGKLFDGLTGILSLGKSIYKEAHKPNGSGEEIVVAVGNTVARSATTALLTSAGLALTSSVFPLLVPGILTVAAVGAGLWYLPDMAASATEKTIRGLGYAAGLSGEQGRDAYEWLQEKGMQIGNKISQAEDGVDQFKELLERRKYR
jgi:hypothetical protein